MADNTDIFSQDFDARALVDAAVTRGEQVERDTVWQTMYDKQQNDEMFPGQSPEMAWKFIKRLPRNIGVGALNAGLAAIGFAEDIGTVISGQNLKVKDEKGNVSQATTGRPVSKVEDDGTITKMPALPSPLRDPIEAWRNEVTRNDSTSDALTQGISQFVIPFAAYTKLANVSRAQSWLVTAGKLVGAEAATAGTAFDPHDARGADLLQLGREAENKFGEVLREVSPDGSLLNAYINYMTDREDEGEWEGRYKNIVDSLGLTAATAGLLKAVPFSMKAARYAAENAAVGPTFGSKAAQGGWIGYHGSPEHFDKFDFSKIGTGEGAQVYGHGLYFAEAKDVGRTYMRAGRRSDMPFSYAEYGGRRYKGDTPRAKMMFEAQMQGRAPVRARLKAELERIERSNPERAQELRGEIDFLNKLNPDNVKIEGAGNLYSVEIPDNVVGAMLDWDKPLSEQPGSVKNALKAFGIGSDAAPETMSDLQLKGALGGFENTLGRGEATGQKLYKELVSELGSAEKASAALDKAGITGIRYLDGGSRTPNVVQASWWKLLEKNGGDKTKTIDQITASVYDPKEKKQLRTFLEANLKPPTRNLVLFDDKHVTIKGKE